MFTFLDKLPWVWQAVICGALFGHGIILANMATRMGTSLMVSIGTFGIMLTVPGFFLASKIDATVPTTTAWIVLAVAGLAFFVGNVFQFSATVRAPLSAYALLVITAVNISITVVYDVTRLLKTGSFTASSLEISAVACGVLSIILFALASK